MNNLLVIKNINAIEVFSGGGLDQVVKKIESEVRAFVPDMSTEAGRKEIASVAHKVARSKAALDSAGKELVSGWKAKAKLVDASRKEMRERLDSLKDEIRKPLTDWEEADKKRIYDLESTIKEIQDIGLAITYSVDNITINDMNDAIDVVNDLFNRDWQEFKTRAKMAHDQALINIQHGISQRKAADEAEAAKVEYEKKAQAEREAKIAKDAAERAKREAEEKAARDRIEAEEKAESERNRIIKEAAEKLAKEQAEKDRAIQAKKNAEEKSRLKTIRLKAEAQADQELAIQKERDRVAAKEVADRLIKDKEEAAAKRKAESKAHQKKINNEALKSITAIGISESDGKKLVTAIAMNEIKHIFMEY